MHNINIKENFSNDKDFTLDIDTINISNEMIDGFITAVNDKNEQCANKNSSEIHVPRDRNTLDTPWDKYDYGIDGNILNKQITNLDLQTMNIEYFLKKCVLSQMDTINRVYMGDAHDFNAEVL